MAFRYLNRVREFVASAPGTGVIQIGASVPGFAGFSDMGMLDGDLTSYLIEDGAPLGTLWELGVGTWHAPVGGGNATFSRDWPIANSTIGSEGGYGSGTITATSAAVLSATLLAEDAFRTALIIQSGTVHANAAGAVSITLPAAPSPGNILVAFGRGGGTTADPVGFNFAGADSAYAFGNSAQDINAAMRVVRSGDGATWSVGSLGSGGAPFAGALVELARADPTRITGVNAYPVQGAAAIAMEALAPTASLMLGFGAGDPNGVFISPAGAIALSTLNGSSLTLNAMEAQGPLASWNVSAGAGSVTNGACAVMLIIPGV